MKMKILKKYVCEQCNSENVYFRCWYNPNTAETLEDIEGTYNKDSWWCQDCAETVAE